MPSLCVFNEATGNSPVGTSSQENDDNVYDACAHDMAAEAWCMGCELGVGALCAGGTIIEGQECPC